jgi:hypothetical protein
MNCVGIPESRCEAPTETCGKTESQFWLCPYGCQPRVRYLRCKLAAHHIQPRSANLVIVPAFSECVLHDPWVLRRGFVVGGSGTGALIPMVRAAGDANLS